MFERFTDESRRVLVLAQECARTLGVAYIGPEHFLVGLAVEGSAASLLGTHGVTEERIREHLATATFPTMVGTVGSPPFTTSSKRILEGSLREALAAGRSNIGCIEILIATLRLEDEVTVELFRDLGIDPADLLEEAASLEVESAPGPRETRRPTGLRAMPLPLQRWGPMAPPSAGNQCLFCGRDLWEVEHSVTNGTIAICEVCVGDSARMIADASPEDRSLTLPPRLFGDAPDDQAISAVAEAVTAVFGGPSDDDLGRYLEDAPTLGPYLRQAGERVSPGDVVATIRRVRFTASGTAWVEVLIRVGLGIQFSLEGPVRLTDGGWQVTRELLSSAVSRAGVQIPPES